MTLAQFSARCASLVLAVLSGACTIAPLSTVVRSDPAQHSCVQWLARLDDTVAHAGVADVQEARMAGHPHLRSNRFTAALAQDPGVDEPSFVAEVVPAMRQLDRAARSAEISNLPAQDLVTLEMTRDQVRRRSEDCAAVLLEGDPPVRSSVVVADAYSASQRLLGGYALARHPFTAGVQHHLDSVREAFVRPLVTPPGAHIVRYVPAPTQDGSVDPDALLLDRHQPVFEKEVGGEEDAAGALVWDAAQGRPQVDRAQPAVYRQVSQTRYRGRTLKQLVYTLWFGARPADGPLDLLAGHLDGIIWRVTLDHRGQVLIHDTAHPCGCYHYFFPTALARAMAAPTDEPEWAFVPQTLGTVQPGSRVVLRIATRTSYLERVTLPDAASAVQAGVPLQSLPQDALRALPVRGGVGATQPTPAPTRSAYGPDALVPGTQRAERWFFWPMGIASAGQMRQWGHHATAFVGRRHFDDANLFDQRFEFVLGD